ncbi:hypothetical protein [Streptomyces aureocirculatus]|uniref:hypothetical protein n=1 Tax=Streptomyces aureocirculatus TaxID=67275 RepID=UPI00068BB5A1|nr:hypothetical protein [Streptomyces aureocirculatus]
MICQQVFDPEFSRTWAAYLEHHSRNPAEGRGRPLPERLAEVGGGALPADRVFHPMTDLRDEQSVKLLLRGETVQDR